MTVIGSIRKRQSVAVDLTASDLDRLIDSLRGMSCGQARQAVARVMIEDDRLNAEDIETIRTHKARSLSKEGLLEFFPAQDNNVELGGFEGLKTWLERARMGFGPAAREWNLDPPRGVMLTGVQGCGKSLAARAVASSWGLPLLKLDAGRLYDKYYGASEKNLRRAIELAESMAPAVLWIDEIEKGFASFGSSDGHDGVSQRIFATLLTWLQEKKESVFVVATANDIFRLPPELLRKGRFDEIFFVDLPVASERETILRIHMERRRQNPEVFDLQALVAASDGMSGAEIEQAVVSALYGARHDACLLDTEGLLDELKATVPLSVSRREDLERLRALATDRFVPVRGATRPQSASS
jgi:SpoVK/Ycf46/Vps4 family AAA+-type ATPase